MRTAHILPICLCSLLVCPALLIARQTDTASSDLNSAINLVKKIHHQMIYSKPCHPPTLACLGSGPGSLKDLLRDYTVSALNKTGGDLKSLVADFRQIDDAEFAVEMNKRGYGLQRNWDVDPPFAIKKELPVGDVVITLNHFSMGTIIPSDVVIIQAFRKEGGIYVFADQTGDDLFEASVYTFKMLGSPQSGELWLLVQGQVPYMGDLERARLYSFDGYKFTEEWKPKDRLSMSIKVKGGVIDARYISKKSGGVSQPDTQDCMEEKLQIGASELVNLGIINYGECENYQTAQ